MGLVLIACEESQVVCKAFRELGHEAYSNDVQECSGGHPEWHLQFDVFGIIHGCWDLIICFPPCTRLSGAGAPQWKKWQTNGEQQLAVKFVKKLWNLPSDRICIENPTGYLNTHWRKPDQIINPYQFGDEFKKRTCLWLKGLPKLIPTNIVEPKYHYTSNSTRGGLLKDGTRKKSELPIFKAWDNSKERSKSFVGIAKAMAEQWGGLI